MWSLKWPYVTAILADKGRLLKDWGALPVTLSLAPTECNQQYRAITVYCAKGSPCKPIYLLVTLCINIQNENGHTHLRITFKFYMRYLSYSLHITYIHSSCLRGNVPFKYFKINYVIKLFLVSFLTDSICNSIFFPICFRQTHTSLKWKIQVASHCWKTAACLFKVVLKKIVRHKAKHSKKTWWSFNF